MTSFAGGAGAKPLRRLAHGCAASSPAIGLAPVESSGADKATPDDPLLHLPEKANSADGCSRRCRQTSRVGGGHTMKAHEPEVRIMYIMSKSWQAVGK